MTDVREFRRTLNAAPAADDKYKAPLDSQLITKKQKKRRLCQKSCPFEEQTLGQRRLLEGAEGVEGESERRARIFLTRAKKTFFKNLKSLDKKTLGKQANLRNTKGILKGSFKK
jgi:hypothetical protein